MVNKKYAIIAGMAIILTAVSGYLVYDETYTRKDVLEEVDFSTLKEAEIDAMAMVKEKMNANMPSASEQK